MNCEQGRSVNGELFGKIEMACENEVDFFDHPVDKKQKFQYFYMLDFF
jgi:hypothetical protein